MNYIKFTSIENILHIAKKGGIYILVDDEIDDELICQHDPINEKIGVFADPRTKICQDVLNKQKKKVFDIYEDESDYPGDVC